MATALEPPPERDRPAAGVIRDARARQARRRTLVAVLALAAAGGILAGALGGSGGHARESARERALRQVLDLRRHRSRAIGQISPALEGGSYGWEVRAARAGSIGIGGSCCTLATVNLHTAGPWVGVATMSSGDAHEDSLIAILPSRVRGFVSRRGRGRLTTLARLPYGLRLAAITVVRRPKQPGLGVQPHGLLALDARGRPLGYMETPESFGRAARWWKTPARPPAGPCEIRARGLPGLEPKWGHVAVAVSPYPRRVIGRAFFSCVDTEYYLHHWPLTTAVLLDAQRPGALPAAIPGMRPAPAAHGVVEAPSDWHGRLTAVRIRDAWLVVAGGSGPAQRLQVLRHIEATVSLRGPHKR
ncbi:MAG TPA: hypothetical protein VHT27_10770 [Solirubrobacteraceae bacterium]|jgi:hypothetical protein|nr:hypothetical protein [Solirubrobacteraceae bacterium]